MTDQSPVPQPEWLDAAERQNLTRYLLELGATEEEIAATPDLMEKALDMNLRRPGRLTVGEVVQSTALPRGLAQRLLAGLGFPTDPGAPLTDAEAEAVRLFAAASQQLLGPDATVQLARVSGAAMTRIADTLVTLFRIQYELPRRDAGTGYFEMVQDYADMAQRLLPSFSDALDAILRREIVAVSERMWSTDEERFAVTLTRTVGFADLVGYTETAAAMSVRELTEVLIGFDDLTTDTVSRGHGQIIKTIGDEAMFATESAADACRIALDLVDAFGRDRLPPVRVGLATGLVVSVSGDLYGPDVNLAARLVDVAAPATVVAAASVRDATVAGTAAGDATVGDGPDGLRFEPGGFRFESLPPVTLKGFPAPVAAYRLSR